MTKFALLPLSIKFFCYFHGFLCIYFQFAGSQFLKFLCWEEPEKKHNTYLCITLSGE